MDDKAMEQVLQDQTTFLRDAANAHRETCKAKRSVFVGANFANCSACGWHITAIVRNGKAAIWERGPGIK